MPEPRPDARAMSNSGKIMAEIYNIKNLELRKAVLGDEKTLAFIQVQSWRSAFRDILSSEDLARYTDLEKTQEMYRHVLSHEPVRIWMLSIDGQPHAIAAWGDNRDGFDSDIAELICIHSLPGNWRKGYGSCLMRQVLTDIQQAGYTGVVLWVFEQNSRARQFYERHGFSSTEQIRVNFNATERLYRKIF